jgi:hypothetical protein
MYVQMHRISLEKNGIGKRIKVSDIELHGFYDNDLDKHILSG